MKDNWGKAIEFVLKWEREEKVNDPNDPGGLTIYGVSSKNFPETVKKLDEMFEKGDKDGCRKLATEFYKNEFWDRIAGDTLESPMDIVMMNCAVNCGVGRAMELYALNKDWRDFLIAQIRHYRKCNNAKFFLDDWLVRTIELWKLIHKSMEWEVNR